MSSIDPTFRFHLLDSGAIYRVFGLAAAKQHIDFSDEQALSALPKA